MVNRLSRAAVLLIGIALGVILGLWLWQQLTPDGRTLALWYALGLAALFGIMALWWQQD